MAASAGELKLKVCVVGPPSVGKSSLIRRFVYDAFTESYVATIGANMSKRVISVTPVGSREAWSVSMVVWDIMGQRTFRELLLGAYFQGAHGVLAVADLTRPETFGEVAEWIAAVKDIAGDRVPVVLLGNKSDLVDAKKADLSALDAAAKNYGTTLRFTSAKTGEHVEAAFRELGSKALGKYLESEREVGSVTG